MKGNIITIPYNSSSWQSLRDEKGFETTDKPVIMVTKAGYVTDQWQEKGSGSAYGGKWIPKKPEDERLLGVPGEIKTSYDSRGNLIQTKIGDDGQGKIERHNTDLPNPKFHTNPHDHIIDWSEGFPKFGPPINYPNGAPEFKFYMEDNNVNAVVKTNSLEDNRFKSISDFKWCVKCGGEIEFEWKGMHYGVSSKLFRTPNSPEQILISQIDIDIGKMNETEKWYDTADEALEYMVGEDRLRDVITQVTVWARTI